MSCKAAMKLFCKNFSTEILCTVVGTKTVVVTIAIKCIKRRVFFLHTVYLLCVSRIITFIEQFKCIFF